MMMRSVGLLAFVCASLVGCGRGASTATPAPTPTVTPIPICRVADGRTAYDRLFAASNAFVDTVTLAGNTPRLAVSPHVAKMQELRRDMQAEKWPDCAKTASSMLLVTMDNYINGFVAFLGQSDQKTYFEDGTASFKLYLVELTKIKP